MEEVEPLKKGTHYFRGALYLEVISCAEPSVFFREISFIERVLFRGFAV